MNWPKNTACIVVPETRSTNGDVSKLLARERGPLWLMARRQTAGRGRRGRDWLAPQGNFAASWGGYPCMDINALPQMSFVTALSLYDALVSFAAQLETRLTLKWPNDVLLDSRKLAGILLETVGPLPKPGLVIGIGVNLTSAPQQTDLEDSAMAPACLAPEFLITQEEMLDALATAFDARFREYADQGFAPIRAAWRKRSAGIGQNLTARLHTTSHRGRFVDIDDAGSLILETEQGRLVLPAADVYL